MADTTTDLRRLTALGAALLDEQSGAARRASLERQLAALRAYADRLPSPVPGAPPDGPAAEYWSMLRALRATSDLGLAALARHCLRTASPYWPEAVGPDTPVPLTVRGVEPTGRDGRLVELAVPDQWRDRLRWRAGQHVGVDVELGGVAAHRSYSVCTPTSALDDGTLTIAVRRSRPGLVSVAIADRLGVGDRLDVSPPAGEMTWPDEELGAVDRALLVAGGSGITPVHALAAEILARTERGRVALLVVERAPGDVMLGERLRALARAHPGRLTLAGHWTRGPQGRATPETLAPQLEALARRLTPGGGPGVPLAYLCGPDALAQICRAALTAAGVADDAVRAESFTAAAGAVAEAPRPGGRLRVRLGDEVLDVTVEPGESLLAALFRQGREHPFSCLAGRCGTCRIEVVAGDVAPPTAIRDDGTVLACIGAPSGG